MGSMDPFVSLSANLGKVEASKILGRSISLIMNHSGFDGKMKIALKWIAIYESALCTFIDLVTEYISNFGKNIKLCLDGTAPIMSTEVPFYFIILRRLFNLLSPKMEFMISMFYIPIY